MMSSHPGGSPLRHDPPAHELAPLCGERPTGCMGFVAMQRACVLPERHKGDHESKDNTTFPRKAARRVVEERRAVGR